MQGNIEEIVAIKCIERSRLNKISTENLFTEIEVMKGLNYKHIVKLKSFDVSIYIVKLNLKSNNNVIQTIKFCET